MNDVKFGYIIATYNAYFESTFTRTQTVLRLLLVAEITSNDDVSSAVPCCDSQPFVANNLWQLASSGTENKQSEQ